MARRCLILLLCLFAMDSTADDAFQPSALNTLADALLVFADAQHAEGRTLEASAVLLAAMEVEGPQFIQMFRRYNEWMGKHYSAFYTESGIIKAVQEVLFRRPPVSGQLIPGKQVWVSPLSMRLDGSWGSVVDPETGSEQVRILDHEYVAIMNKMTLRKTHPVLWDVGVNTASFSLLPTVHPGLRVLGWEPIPLAYDLAKRSVALNGIADRVLIHCAALSNVTDTVLDLRVPLSAKQDAWTGFGTGFATLGTNSFWFHKSETMSIPTVVTTVDQYMATYDMPPVDFMKLDVEGGELAVLLGAEATIRRDSPDIMFENADFWTASFGHSANLTVDLLHSWGYEHVMLNPYNGYAVKRSSPEIVLINGFENDAVSFNSTSHVFFVAYGLAVSEENPLYIQVGDSTPISHYSATGAVTLNHLTPGPTTVEFVVINGEEMLSSSFSFTVL